MADTYTTNLNLTKPEPGAAEDTWGISLNSDLDTLDAIFSSSGTQVNLNPNQVNFADNKKAVFGTGADLQIYHTGTQNYIEDAGTGNLNFKSNGNNFNFLDGSDNLVLQIDLNSATKLYHNTSEKLATTSTGIDVTGTVVSDGFTVEGDATIKGGSDVSNTGATLQLESTETQAVGSGASISFKGNDGSGTQRVFGVIKGSKTSATSGNFNGGLDFFTRVTAEANARKRLAIASNGDISFYEDTGTSQALFWDASAESLSIGTTSPTAKLEISTTDGVESLRINSLDTQVTEGELIGEILFTSNDATLNANRKVLAGIKTFAAENFAGANANEASLQFFTANSNDLRNSAAPSPRMTINEDGKVGIGTSSLDGILTLKQLANSDSNGLDGIRIDASTGTTYAGFGLVDTTGKLAITAGDAGGTADTKIVFKTASSGSESEVARFSSTGRLGIGTSAPSRILEIEDSVPAVRLTDTTTSGMYHEILGDGNSLSIEADDGNVGSNSSINFKVDGIQRARITSTGTLNVIADANNGVKISSASPYLFFNDTDTANTYDSSISQSGATLNIGGATPAQTLKFRNKASFGESARIDTSGNLLVGKTAAGHNTAGFQIEQSGLTGICRSNALPLIINRKTSNGIVTEFRIDNVHAGTIRTYSGDLVVNNNDVGLRFNDGNNSIHPVVTGGAVRDNLTDLGLSNARFKNLYLGSNIILSGTSANEGYIALPDSDLPTSTTHKLYHSNDTLYWNGDSVDTTSTSDYRAKKDIQPLKDGLERVNKLNPVEFRYIEDDKYSEGFIAHELQEVWEHGVHGEKDGDIMQSVSYGRITPLLVKAIQEQQEQIESLKSEIANLKGE